MIYMSIGHCRKQFTPSIWRYIVTQAIMKINYLFDQNCSWYEELGDIIGFLYILIITDLCIITK